MKTRFGVFFLIGAMVLGWGSLAVGQELPPTVRVLLIDETKTFTSTMKVAGTIGALRQMGLFDLSVRLADVETDYSDPLAGILPEKDQEPFDLILILPRGLDTRTDVSIWLVSNALNTLSPFTLGAVDLISTVVDQVFASSGQTMNVSEDLWPGLLQASYVLKGWME